MKKLAVAARDFAANPPPSVVFMPAPYKIIREHKRTSSTDTWYETEDRIPFDDMEIGDLVVLRHVTTSYYQGGKKPTVSETWYPARCVSAAKNRVFEIFSETGVPFRWVEGHTAFEVWRVTYRWRASVQKILGREFSSREQLETFMEIAP